MERDIILADEIIGFGGQRLFCTGDPPVFPAVRLALALCPFDAGGKIANDGIEPDIDALIRITLQWQGHAPVQIARDGAWLQPFGQPAFGEGKRVGPPRSEERRVGKECRSRWSPYH